jgi:hypothetical protein
MSEGKWKCEPFADSFGELWLKRTSTGYEGGYWISNDDQGDLIDISVLGAGHVQAKWRPQGATRPSGLVTFRVAGNELTEGQWYYENGYGGSFRAQLIEGFVPPGVSAQGLDKELWTITRDKGLKRAYVTAKKDQAPYEVLAAAARLDPTGAAFWLKTHKPNDQVRRSDVFTIPNTVVIAFGEMNFIARGVAKPCALLARGKLEDKGLHVLWLEYAHKKWSTVELRAHKEDMLGFLFFGHGYAQGGKVLPGGIINDPEQAGQIQIDSELDLGPEFFRRKQLSFIVIKACGASHADWETLVWDRNKAWLGSGIEVSAVTWGILDLIDEALLGMR